MNGEPPVPTRFRSHRVLTVGFAVVSLGLLVLLVAIYWQLAHPILWAATLAVLYFPAHAPLVRLLGGRARLAAGVSTFVVLAVVLAPAVAGAVRLVQEAQNLWPSLRDSLGPNGFEHLARIIEQSRFRGLAHALLGGAGGGVSGAEALQAKLQSGSMAVQGFVLDRLRDVSRSAPAVFLDVAVTVLAFYFFLLHGPVWVREFEQALPLERSYARRLFDIAGQSINAVFRGVLVTALIQAVLAGIGYWIAGTPVPVLLAVVTFIAALIPFVGAAAAWIPISIALYVAGRLGAAIGLALWGLLAVSLVDNFIKPYLIGRGMKLPMLWLFLAILGGLKLFGFLGIVLGPAVLALALACYRIYRAG